MKTKKVAAPAPIDDKSTGAPIRHVKRVPKLAQARRSSPPGSGGADPASPPPAQGTIRLDLTNLTPTALIALLKLIKDGLTGNVYYPDFAAELALLASSESGMLALMETLTSLDQQWKAIRAALATEILTAQNNLRTVGLACENYDRTDEALLSVGWPLRRIPGPPQPVTAPAGLTALNSAFSGQLKLRWSRVANNRYYEIQTIPLEDLVNDGSWDTVPVKSWPRVQYTVDGYESGRLISIRVRAFGAKGPGPWAKSINARVS